MASQAGGTAGPPAGPDDPGKTGLTTAADFIKYAVALGTGALVFSVGLVSKDIDLSGIGQVLLIASWSLLAFSIATGVLAYSRIPVQLAEENFDLEDKWLVIPGRIHQITFLLGILCLGTALIFALLSTNQAARPKPVTTTTPQNKPTAPETPSGSKKPCRVVPNDRTKQQSSRSSGSLGEVGRGK